MKMSADPVTLIVRSEPSDPTMLDRYHAWYADHLRQLLAVPGVEVAQRYESIDGDMRYMARYELESTDVFDTEAYRAIGRFGPMERHVRFTRNVYRTMPPTRNGQ